jgi:hypothetical protein
MRYIFVLYCILLSFIGPAQSLVSFVEEEMPHDSVLVSDFTEHTAIKPFLQSSIKHTTLSISNSHASFGIKGICDAGFFVGSGNVVRLGVGALTEIQPRNDLYIRVAAIQGFTNDTSRFVPMSYTMGKHKNQTLFTDIRARISYSPNTIFNFQLGLDKNFIGEGSRSLFLSDYGKAYPFGMIRTKFWKVEYMVLYQFFREETIKGWLRKNGATHYLSFNATKWLNLGLFETVIFLPKDTMLNRGYDAEYLNPIVFYRPQEYSLGSSDNVLLGASFSARVKSHTFYGQFLLDEFFLSEIKAKSGWWANKYGGQLGVKGRVVEQGLPLFYRLEYNSMRPYTYAHLNNGQNYGNMGSVLAHPLGANFMEILGELKAQRGKWNIKLFVSYFLQGLDKNNFSYGGDIYQPYTKRPKDYANFIGQGRGNNGIVAFLHAGYCLHKETNLNFFIENRMRYDSTFGKYTYQAIIGIRSQLWNDYRNY